jgi:UDP-2,3-diacylglucosamine pyrophosphatase LpxH
MEEIKKLANTEFPLLDLEFIVNSMEKVLKKSQRNHLTVNKLFNRVTFYGVKNNGSMDEVECKQCGKVIIAHYHSNGFTKLETKYFSI